MIELGVQIPSLAELVGRLELFRQDQLPYALSEGMNRAGKDARDRFRAHMDQVFTVRYTKLPKLIGPFGQFAGGKSNKQVKPDGRIIGRNSDERASKAIGDGWSHRTQWPNLQVRFFSRAHALGRQESGGTKPNKASHVWLPTKHVKREGGSGLKRISRHRPSKIKRQLKAKRQRVEWRVFQRGNRIFERHRDSEVVYPLYTLRELVYVPPRMRLEQLVVEVYRAKLWPRFSQSMQKALRTAKPKNRFTK